MQQTKCFAIFDCFLPFYPPNNLKNQNFEKLKKQPGDIIISHMYPINDNHVIFGSWDMECDRQNLLSFWTVFCPFYPTNNAKNQNFEKMEKGLEILFYTCVPRMTIIWCIVPEISSVTNKIFCHFGHFFPFTPLTTWKIKILKKWKRHLGDIIILHKCTINDNHMMFGSWDMEHDGQNFLSFWTIFCLFYLPH